MSWLIDAEVLIDNIENNGDKAIIDMIEAQPIAFDVEKVVQELDSYIVQKCELSALEYHRNLAFEKAIEIVKRGVINE